MRRQSPIPRLLSALGLSLWACDSTTSDPVAGEDFNPMPVSGEYAFSKEIRSQSVMASFGGECLTEVHRKPFPESAAAQERRFIDSNSVSCIFRTATDTTPFTATYLDTVVFREGYSSLTFEGADRFFNLALPPGLHPDYPAGFEGGSDYGDSPQATFPKQTFPENANMVRVNPNYAAKCWYLEAGVRTACRRLIETDMRYRSQSLVFLAGPGFLSMDFSWSGAPLGASNTGSTKVRLLYRILGGDTLRYTGTIQNS